MVVLAGAICTKNGKALVSRQFVDLSKVRIEGLLAAFPKLMGSGKQHTFIDTESVRYIYQPLESLYILLLTNKASNILEDLETLHLLAKVVPEYTHLEEAEVTKHAFELIFAFDEVIAMGYKERVTSQQIKAFTTMESHEEERARVEQERKEDDAKREARKRMKDIAAVKKKDEGYAGGMGSSSSMGSGSHTPYISSGSSSAARAPYVEETKAAPKDSRPIVGMKLGAKTKKSELAKVLKEEKIVEREEEVDNLADGSVLPSPGPGAAATENVHIEIEEQLVIRIENDGGLESMEIKGGLSVTCFDSAVSRVKVSVNLGDNSTFQIKTHPLMDKALFNNGELKLKEGARAFPTATPAGILKWRAQTKDESLLPLTINCWPSQGNDGQTIVNMDYELLAPFELRNVSIAVPIPKTGSPVVSAVDGQYDFNAKERVLYWKHPIIDESNKSGSMEFTTTRVDASAFFPLQITFSATKTYFSVEVVEVVAEETGKPVKYSQTTQLTVEQYEIV